MDFKGQNWRDLAPRSSAYLTPDDEYQWLQCRVSPGGAHTWVVRWRPGTRKNQVTKVIEPCEVLSPTEARKRARSIMANWVEPEQVAATSLGDMLEDFYATYVMRPGENRPYAAAESYRTGQRWFLDKKILPAIGNMPLAEVNEGTITTLLTKTITGRVNQNRCQSLLHKAYNWARRQEAYLRIENPVTGHPKNPETPKDDRLLPEGVRRLGKAWRESRDPLKDVCIWPLVVGTRKSAARLFFCGEFDTAERVVRFPDDVELLKGCELVYIPKCIMEISKGMPKSETDKYAFRRAWDRLRKKAGITETTHDMRRTFTSFGGDLGYSANAMNLVTGHASGAGKVADTYYRPADATFRKIVDRVGAHIWKLLHEDPIESPAGVNKIAAKASPCPTGLPKRRKRAE